MTDEKLLSDIMDALKINQMEHEEMRRTMAGLATKKELAELATKKELAGLATKKELSGLATKKELSGLATKKELQALREEVSALAAELGRQMAGLTADVKKLGLEFEAFRRDIVDIIQTSRDLAPRVAAQEKTTENLDRRLSRVESHLDLKPLKGPS